MTRDEVVMMILDKHGYTYDEENLEETIKYLNMGDLSEMTLGECETIIKWCRSELPGFPGGAS